MGNSEKAEIVMDGCVKMIIPRRCGGGGNNGEGQGEFIRCCIVEDLIRGERQTWRVISMVSSGIEFVRDLVLEMDAEGPHSKTQ